MNTWIFSSLCQSLHRCWTVNFIIHLKSLKKLFPLLWLNNYNEEQTDDFSLALKRRLWLMNLDKIIKMLWGKFIWAYRALIQSLKGSTFPLKWWVNGERMLNRIWFANEQWGNAHTQFSGLFLFNVAKRQTLAKLLPYHIHISSVLIILDMQLPVKNL